MHAATRLPPKAQSSPGVPSKKHGPQHRPPPREPLLLENPKEPPSHLLKVSSEAVHVLVIGQKRMGFCAVTVDVPDPQHRQQHGDVLLQGS